MIRIAHIIYRLDYGGLENGLVNLVNRLPVNEFHHTVICITNYTEFRERIARPDVDVFELNKKSGKDPAYYFRLWKLLRKIKPNIVHTRNLGAIDCNVIAKLSGVRHCIHSEHGWVIEDAYGKHKKHILLRKVCNIFINHYIALSKNIKKWLLGTIRVNNCKISQIYNGVDTDKFVANGQIDKRLENKEDIFTVVTVGRLDPIKNHMIQLQAIKFLKQNSPEEYSNIRLKLVGDGQEKSNLETYLYENNLQESVMLLGSRNDICELLQDADIFILSSINEGISNTILEAMAVGLPVIATNVGGNPELVIHNETGFFTRSAAYG